MANVRINLACCDGGRMRRKYSDEVKAAVMAALLAGQSVSQTAKEYGIPKGTVSGWRAHLNGVAKVTTQKKERIGELLVEYLNENLITLKAQAVFSRSEKWLNKQTAAELAVLHGVMNDKSRSLLEALSNAAND